MASHEVLRLAFVFRKMAEALFEVILGGGALT